jgi:multicomponent Na+:H+ antiporter subunit E
MSRGRIRRLVPHLAVYAGLWWLLTGGTAASWPVGLPVVLAAAWSSAALAPALRLDIVEAARFLSFFLSRSVASGIDVAERALHLPPRLHPGIIRFETRLLGPSGKVFFTCVLSLLPGTLSVAWDGPRLDVHVLDTTSDMEAKLRQLEARVAALFPETASGEREAAG